MTGTPDDSPFGAAMPDLGSLLESAQQMMAQAQAAALHVVEGVAGGGLVKVEVDGRFDFHSVSIDPKAIDPADPELLEDLLLAALRDASTQLQEGQRGALELGGIDLGGRDLGGMDLGGLGTMLGDGDQ